MTIVERWANETRIALQDCGMVHDGVTGSSAEWQREAERIIQDMMVRYLTDVTTDADEAEYGR
jgi:hypothetical protein